MRAGQTGQSSSQDIRQNGFENATVSRDQRGRRELLSRTARNRGGIKAALERAGQLIDDFDIAVAAIALAHGAQVITANLPHFARVKGLRSCHWI